MIRVLMIVPRFESTGRGVEVFAKYLACGLDKTQFEVTVISGPHASELPGVNCKKFPLIIREKIERSIGWMLKYIPRRLLCGPFDLESLSLMWKARHFLGRESFDIILPFGGTWTYRFAKYFKKNAKIISVGHAGPVRSDLALSDYFVALTPTDQSQAISIDPAIESSVIPNGVDVKKFHPPLNRAIENTQTILCVGAFTEDKRQDLLLEAIQLLPSTINCILAGRGPQKQVLENHALVRMGRVKLVEQAYDRMPQLYQEADVFTLPAPNEAFGLVFLEALASGLPVVASNGPRQHFVIGQTGFFCDVFNPVEYARALNSALNSPFDQARIDHAHEFSWDQVVMKYADLMKSLAGDAALKVY